MEGFLLIQTRRSAIEDAFAQIGAIDGVVFAERTSGPYDIIVTVRGATELSIKAILECIRSLEGVLRVLLAPLIIGPVV
jgi:nitrate reductase NapAB chaperone NapD